MNITRTSDHKGAAIWKSNDTIHELLKHGSSISLFRESEILIWNILVDHVGTLLHESIVGVGANNKLTGRSLLLYWLLNWLFLN